MLEKTFLHSFTYDTCCFNVIYKMTQGVYSFQIQARNTTKNYKNGVNSILSVGKTFSCIAATNTLH